MITLILLASGSADRAKASRADLAEGIVTNMISNGSPTNQDLIALLISGPLSIVGTTIVACKFGTYLGIRRGSIGLS